MKYRITLKKAGGGEESRTIEAPSRFAIYDSIHKEGGIVKELRELHGMVLPSFGSITIGTGIKRRDVITMAKNLSAMLGAGLSLARALSILERQSRNRYFKKLVSELSVSITGGKTFHEALADHPKVFSKLFIAMVRAGEESGGLTDALLTVGTQMERSQELSRKVKGAMIYPAIVLTAIIIVAILMLMYVVPTLTATFTQLNVELPTATKVIVAMSDFLTNNSIVFITALFAFFVGVVTFVRSSVGKPLVISGALHIPVIGELVRETFAARASRTFASLLTSGVPVLAALSITEEVVGSAPFDVVIREAVARVKKGDPVSAAFIEHENLYPIMMSDMIAVGEETGKLAEMLKQVAEYYENDVALKTKDLSTIIEPILMLFVGGMVGVFAIAVISPIYSLSSAI